MNNTIPATMTRLDLIRMIGDVTVKVDEIRSTFDREAPNRVKLDNIRDELDTYQRKLVRSVINDNTKQFNDLAISLKGINADLRSTIDNLEKIAKSLETLVEFVGVVQKIIELIP